VTDQENKSKTIESSGVFTSAQIKSLHSRWLETVEQVISATATDDGREGLAKLLEVEKDVLNDILITLSQMLPPEVLNEISKPTPEKQRGVIFPEKQQDSPKDGGSK